MLWDQYCMYNKYDISKYLPMSFKFVYAELYSACVY